MTKFTRAELIGRKSPYPWFSENKRDQYESQNNALEKPEVSRQERCYRKKNGELLWIALSIKPVKDQEQVKYFLSNWIDITASKAAEERLKRSEELFRFLAENAKDLIYRYSFSPTRGFEYVSPSSTAITGYTPEEHYTDPNLGLKMIHPDDRRTFQDVRIHPPQSSKPLIFRWIRKDGRMIWTEQQNTRIRDKNGLIIAVEGIVRDITEHKQIEEALQASQKFNESLLNNALTPILVINPDGSIRYTNPAFEKLTGFSSQELTGQKPPYPYWPQDHIEIYEDIVLKAALNQHRGRSEKLFQSKNKDFFWVETLGTPIKDAQGNTDSFLISWVNITERKLSEEALKKSQAFNSTLLDNTPYPILVTDLESSIIFVNPALEELTGYSSEEIIGLMSPYPWWPPEIADQYLNENNREIRNIRNKIERCFRKKNGDEFWVELTINPIQDQEKVQFYIGNWVDVTERKKSEKALMDSENKYRNLVNNIKLGIFRSTPGERGRFLEINNALEEITGYTREELLNMDVSHLYFDPKERGNVSREALTVKERFSREILYQKKDATSITIALTMFPVKNTQGEILYFDGILEDVTEKRTAEKKALEAETYRQLDKVKNELLTNVSHELRTPPRFDQGFYRDSDRARCEMEPETTIGLSK